MLRASARAARRARHGAPKRATSSQSEAAAARSDRCAPDRPRARAVPRDAPPPRRLATPRDVPSDPIPRDPSHNLTPPPPSPSPPPFSQNRASRRRERRRVQPHDPRRPPVDARRPHVDARPRLPDATAATMSPSSRRCPTTSRAVGRRGRRARRRRSPRRRAFLPPPARHARPRPRAHHRGVRRGVGRRGARRRLRGVLIRRGSSAAVARVSAGPARFAAAVFANLRAPSALFVLGHHARDAVLARRLPNFSGVLVMLLVGGRGFAPATALCLERRAERHADEGRETARPPTRDRDRSVECWFPPTGRSARGWTAYPPLFATWWNAR